MGFNEVVLTVTKGDVLLLFLGFILVMNFIGVIITYADKKFAISHKSRVAEKTLFGVSILGGCLGTYLMMKKIRHKTLHKRFMIGLPIIFCVQIALIVWWLVVWF